MQFFHYASINVINILLLIIEWKNIERKLTNFQYA